MVVNNETHFLAELRAALEALEVRYTLISASRGPTDAQLCTTSGVILTGGDVHVYEPDQLARVSVDETILDSAATPILGICLGHQLIAHHYGSRVAPLPSPVDQEETVVVRGTDPLFHGVPRRFRARVAHDDTVTTLSEPLVQLASSRLGRYEAIRHRDQPIYGLQFHPEASGEHGLTILRNFVGMTTESAP